MSVDVHSKEYQQMAHLLRRAGFGADHETIQRYVRDGIRATVDRLVNFNPGDDLVDDVQDTLQYDVGSTRDLNELQLWWLNRMMHTPNPLQEKMVLFWHGHFVSAYQKVTDTSLLFRQNQLFRRMGMGNFRDLTQAVSKDPAMILYLDNQTNRKGHANENYGRELMELFTLGIGHYTEEDVRQGARAFTGWSLNRATKEYMFIPSQHDFGTKTFLGETGNFNGNDVVDIIVKQPACAPFICSKLYKFFIHDNPTPADVKPFAELFVKHNLDIKPVLTAMFTSPVFYSDKVMWQKFKSPAEFVVDSLRTTGSEIPLRGAPYSMRAMGQELFNAPSVKGWDGGTTWINTTTLFARFNYCVLLSRMNAANSTLLDQIDQTLASGTLQSDGAVVDYYAAHILHRPLSPNAREVMVNYLNTGRDGNPEPFEIPDGGRVKPETRLKVHGLVHMIMLAPEFQLV